MPRSRTFGAVPRESVLVRVQATRKGRVVKTHSFRVEGASPDAVRDVVERALEAEFSRGKDSSDRQRPSSRPADRLGQHHLDVSFDDVIERVRRVDSETGLRTFVREMRRLVPLPSRRHIGAITGRRVMDFQNWLYEQNATWHLTDLQLLALMRSEFPLNTGQVFTGEVETGLDHVASIRADYNRDGHGGPPPRDKGLAQSVSYGRYHSQAAQ